MTFLREIEEHRHLSLRHVHRAQMGGDTPAVREPKNAKIATPDSSFGVPQSLSSKKYFADTRIFIKYFSQKKLYFKKNS